MGQKIEGEVLQQRGTKRGRTAFQNFANHTLRLIEKEVNGKLSSRYVLIAKK